MRNGFRLAAAALALAAFAAPEALAQVATEHPAATGGGMPQLNFGHPLVVAQVVWLLIIFGLLYVVMERVALPGVARVLEERRRRIDGDLEAAQAAKARADEAMAEHRSATARARARACSNSCASRWVASHGAGGRYTTLRTPGMWFPFASVRNRISCPP